MADASRSTGLIQNRMLQLRVLIVEGLTNPKIRRFAVYGGIGCLIGGIVGELLLWATRPPEVKLPTQTLCLLMDVSGSMGVGFGISDAGRFGNKMTEVKSAAVDFVNRQDLTQGRMAVVAFETRAFTASPPTNDRDRLVQAISGLMPLGSTAMDLGISTAISQLPDSPNDVRSILLFTDGSPDNPQAAMLAANQCRNNKIKIIAIGTGDADVNYLAQITGDPSLVFPVSGGNFGEGFKQAEKVIYGGSLMESSSSQRSVFRSMLLVGAWTVLLSLGTSLALIARQNMDLHRDPLPKQQALVGTMGGIAAGLVGGIAGEMLFRTASIGSDIPFLGSLLTQIGRIVGWTLLGGLLARGFAFFIPNLEPRRAWLGGALGGAVAAVAFILASLLGDVLGRLLGAAILGAIIGMMIAIVEAVSRRTWLEVRFGPKEKIQVNLGATPVKIGSDSRSCTVYARGARPIAAAYLLNEGRVTFTDYEKENTIDIGIGDERTFGNVVATVRSAVVADDGMPDVGAAAVATQPVSRRTTPPPPPPKASPPPAAPARPTAPATPASSPPSSTPKATPTFTPPPPPRVAGGETKVIRPLGPPPPPPKN